MGLKKTLVAGAFSGGMLIATGQAAALTACPAVTLPNGNIIGTAVAVGSLQDCQQQDKIYRDFSTDLPANWRVSISTVLLPIGDQHTITLRPPTSTTPGPFNFTFSYVIEIDPLVQNRVITEAGIDVTQFNGVTVTKNADGDQTDFQLQSVNGSSQNRLGLNERSIAITMSIVGGPNTTLTSISDVYFQRIIPIDVAEPLSIGALGVGLAGLGFAARRRRAV